MVQPAPDWGNPSCWAPSAQGGLHEAPRDAHRRRRRVRGRFHLAGERAGGRESIGRSHRRPCAGHQLGRRPAIPAPWGPVRAARRQPGRGRPAHLAPQAPAQLPDSAALARRARARDRALRNTERGNGRAAHLFGRHGAFARQLRRDATEDGALRLDRKRRRRLPAPQRRALEHHLREPERRPAPAATVSDVALLPADEQAPLEGVIKGEVLRMYQEVAEHPEGEFHFYHGRQAAELFGYERDWLDRAPRGAVASFAGVGNPHLRSRLQPGDTVLDLGGGAGLDSTIAVWQVGATGRVIGVDLNPTMCRKAEAHAAASGVRMACHEGRMEDIPLPDASVDVVISNGVINLSFRKRTVIRELLRVLRPGGRLSITDIVSAKQLSQSIVNDPKLWAS